MIPVDAFSVHPAEDGPRARPDVAIVESITEAIARCAIANEGYFCDLDAVVGDGDFGYSLARGFEAVLAEWERIDRTSAAAFLRRVAVIVTGRMGGTSGPIWGTAFLRAASAADSNADSNADSLDGGTAVTMLRAAIAGIQLRGGAQLGDKTLLDALIPVADEVERRVADGDDFARTLEAAAVVAREAAESTAALRAKRGRASYTGERSVGSVDAGAIAVAVLLEDLAARRSAGNAGTTPDSEAIQ